ncbi:MAG: efflux RND transporter permease subunit, partial [bacterium]
MSGRDSDGGPIAWMARNSVAANLLMIVLIVGGLIIGGQVKQEVFPEFDLDFVVITVPYPGASPAEVEQGIILAVEEGVRGLDGIKRVTSTAREGSGTVVVELLSGSNGNKALQDIKNAVDRITSFPQDSERPVVSLLITRREVISILLYGDQDEHTLRMLAERVRDDLIQKPGITFVELDGVRPLEIAIEVPHEKLRAYDLTLDEIADQVARTAVEIPGGGVKTKGGEVLLRTAERRDFGSEFADIPIISRPDGTNVHLTDIATIIDGFRETDQEAHYNGKPAVRIVVYRVGDETPIEVSDTVKEYVADLKANLPPSVGVATWLDWSDIYRDRMNLLLRNARLGLVLVLMTLGLFLEIRLAFWVTMGIPISFLGSLLLMPAMGVSINMISMFAFIVTLGIVVDDAIVVGENIYELRQRGMPFLKAAIRGAEQIAVPVVFSILTNIAAFMPMFFIPGVTGKFFRVIPSIVVCVFLISLIESLFVLPSHLGHLGPPRDRGIRGFVHHQQQRFSNGLQWFISRLYAPVLRLSARNRYLTTAVGITVLLITVGYVVGGRINFTFMPKVDSDVVTANAVLPYGTPVEKTKVLLARLVEAAQGVLDEHGGEGITRGIYTQIGSPPIGGGPIDVDLAVSGSHLTNVQILLVPSDQRPITASKFATEWHKRLGDLTGLESLTFTYSAGPASGSAIDVQLSHRNVPTLERAAMDLAEALGSYAGVRDVDDGFSWGKPQLDMQVKPEARSLGITASELARQVRSAFYGARAFRQQRGRNEVWIMVRLPEAERKSEYNIEELLIRTHGGGEIPLNEAADIQRGRAYTEINRADGRRTINVTADVVQGVGNANKILADLQKNVVPKLIANYPGLSYSLEGEQRDQREAVQSLGRGAIFALLVIFAMLAIPFRSYIQPLVVMTAIPFGIVGAVLGHVLMGYDLSVISLMGIIALSGVVVN